MSMFWFFIIFIIPVMLFIYSRKRGKELLQLSQNGKKTKATVSDRQQIMRKNGRSYQISYVETWGIGDYGQLNKVYCGITR